MDRINGAGHVNHLFVAEDPATNRPPTEFTPEWFNAVQEEICAPIEHVGMTLSPGDNTQLLRAIQIMLSQSRQAVIYDAAAFAAGVTQGAAVYYDSAEARFDLAVADGTVKQQMVGLADVLGGRVYAFGRCPLFTGLTPGAMYYLSPSTPGALTTVKPSDRIVPVGVAQSASEMYVDVDAQRDRIKVPVYSALRVYSASTVWTKPADLAFVEVLVIGGGGGGGGVYTSDTTTPAAAGGGGAGGWAKHLIMAANLAATETVTVGTGGTGGANTGANGAAGGTSSFGAYISATGGQGGVGNSASATPAVIRGGQGGVGAGSTLSGNGEPGGYGQVFGTGNSSISGGRGGSSLLGGGAPGQYISSGTGGPGFAAVSYGAGGGGAAGYANNDAQGGAGQGGVVIVKEYCYA